jgi:nucleotide-binding universal stress UspA family protein
MVWLADGTWEAAVDAARTHAPDGASVTLLHVTDPAVAETARGAWAGLLGRGHADDPGARIETAAERAESDLLARAAARLDRPARAATRRGRVEREVVAACAGVDLLIVARDGDLSRIGPRSLGPATRFVVDHCPCPVLLIWPEQPSATLPPPPPPPH